MTPFEASLHKFEAYCWEELGPEVGASVSNIIQRDYVDPTGRGLGGLGDAFTDVGETSTPQDYLPGTEGASSPATNVVSSLTDFLGNLSGGVLKTAQTYFTTKAQLDTLKLQANNQAQATRAPVVSSPNNLLMIGGLGLAALLLLSRAAPAAGGRR